MKLHIQPEGQSTTGLSLCTVLVSGSDTIYRAPKYIYEQINPTRFLWKNNRHHKNTVSAFQFQPAVPLSHGITPAKTAKADKQVERPRQQPTSKSWSRGHIRASHLHEPRSFQWKDLEKGERANEQVTPANICPETQQWQGSF